MSVRDRMESLFDVFDPTTVDAESRHAQEPDAAKKVKGYELLLKKAKKEGKSEKDLWAEALKMIASTKAAKKEAVEP